MIIQFVFMFADFNLFYHGTRIVNKCQKFFFFLFSSSHPFSPDCPVWLYLPHLSLSFCGPLFKATQQLSGREREWESSSCKRGWFAPWAFDCGGEIRIIIIICKSSSTTTTTTMARVGPELRTTNKQRTLLFGEEIRVVVWWTCEKVTVVHLEKDIW